MKVTVAVYDFDTAEALASCLDALKAQSHTDVEVLVQDASESSVAFRNRAIDAASGEYIAFLPAHARYACSQTLEFLALTAEAEGARVVMGKTEASHEDETKVFPEEMPLGVERPFSAKEIGLTGGLYGALFERALLRRHHVLFEDFGPLAEARFLEQSVNCAGRLYSLGRILARTSNSFSFGSGVSAESNLPLVSFVVPVYNTEKQVSRCIGTILAIPIRNIEVICIDDGSTDESLALLRRMAEFDHRVRVVSQENGGQGTARNVGISLARGRFVQFVDSDDYIDPEMYPAVLRPFYEHEGLDFVQFSGEVSFDFEPTEKQRQWGKNIFKTQLKPGLHENGPCVWCSTVVWNKVYLRDFLVCNGISFPTKTKQEDEAFTFFVFARAKRMYFIDRPWYKYVRTQTGTMSTQEREAQSSRMPDCYRIFRFIGDFLARESHPMLWGYYFKRVIGATTRFNGTPLEEKCRDCASALLRRHGFDVLRELMVFVDQAKWLQELGHEFFGRRIGNADWQTDQVDISWRCPHEDGSFERPPHPRLSYIVILESFEQFGALTLQTLADQEERSIEVICVAFSQNGVARDLVARFSRKDARFVFCPIRARALDFGWLVNEALPHVRGEYVSILQAKEWVPSGHARVCASVIQGRDVVLVPDVYFDTHTHLPVEQYWQYSRQAGNFPQKESWSIGDCLRLCVNPDGYAHVYRTEFLHTCQKGKPEWRTTSTAWLLHMLSQARCIGVASGTECHLRWGGLYNALPCSEEERLAQNEQLISDLFKVLSEGLICATYTAVRWVLMFVLDKVLWLVERNSALTLPFQLEYGRLPPGLRGMLSAAQAVRVQHILEARESADSTATLQRYAVKLTKIEEARRQIVPDTIIVVSFLLDPYVECIDSWTFFTYLRERGVRAKYVIPKGCRFFTNVVAKSQWRSDVLVIEGEDLGRSYEVFDLILPFLYRVKAIVMEDGFLPAGVANYLKGLNRLSFVLLGHGSTYAWFNGLLSRMFSRFNVVNVAGEMEKSRIVQYYHDERAELPFDFIEAGCPRYDLLSDEGGASGKIVLIALTWRAELNTIDKLEKSFYFRRISQFLASPRRKDLSGKGVRFVFSVHHAMRRTLNDEIPLDTSEVEVIDSLAVSSYIRKAACLITDLSSLAFDFIYQNKPVIYWLPDADDYGLSFLSRDKLRSAQDGLSRLMGYTQASEDVFRQIEWYVEHGFEVNERAREISQKFFPHKGCACERLLVGINEAWARRYGQLEGNS